MQKETVTFDKLPEAVGYLTEQVIELTWIENGRRKTSEQTYEEMLANMQGGVRHKPKSSVKL